jgi:hypothetical protein
VVRRDKDEGLSSCVPHSAGTRRGVDRKCKGLLEPPLQEHPPAAHSTASHGAARSGQAAPDGSGGRASGLCWDDSRFKRDFKRSEVCNATADASFAPCLCSRFQSAITEVAVPASEGQYRPVIFVCTAQCHFCIRRWRGDVPLKQHLRLDASDLRKVPEMPPTNHEQTPLFAKNKFK